MHPPGAGREPDDPGVIALVPAIRERIGAGAAGAVVTEETDTIEEDGPSCSLTCWDGDAPIVVDGALCGTQNAAARTGLADACRCVLVVARSLCGAGPPGGVRRRDPCRL